MPASRGWSAKYGLLAQPIAFATQLMPELQRRGLFRRDYEGRTLREHLGLKRPA